MIKAQFLCRDSDYVWTVYIRVHVYFFDPFFYLCFNDLMFLSFLVLLFLFSVILQILYLYVLNNFRSFVLKYYISYKLLFSHFSTDFYFHSDLALIFWNFTLQCLRIACSHILEFYSLVSKDSMFSYSGVLLFSVKG